MKKSEITQLREVERKTGIKVLEDDNKTLTKAGLFLLFWYGVSLANQMFNAVYNIISRSDKHER